MADALTTTQFILDALRPDQQPEAWSLSVSEHGVDWDDLAVRAIVFGLAPQLHWRLAGWQTAVPPRSAAKLLVTYRSQEQRSAAIYAQLDEVLAACEARGLQPIALKGVHLAACVYAAPALRPMNDIDLLFTPDTIATAEALLTDLGYGGKHKSADLGPGVTKHTSTYKRADGPSAGTVNPYLSAGGDRMIEPHISIEESWFGLKVDITPGVRERATTAVLGQRPCLVLNRTDLLLHICVHFCFHLIQGAPSLVQFSDVLAITQAGDVDWPVFVQRAVDRRAAPFALAALTLAQKLLGAPVPPAVLAQLAAATPAAQRRRIDQMGLADILQRTQQKPLNTVGERIRRGFSDRSETARWAQDWHGRWQVWRTLFQPEKTDTGRILREKLAKSTVNGAPV